MSGLEYGENRSDAAQIRAHLEACDAGFIPRLSDRVDIADYAGKLAAGAHRFEAWEGGELVGLVAVYCNAPDRRQAFITSVSVLPNARGRGIASQLVERCVTATRHASFGRLDLEVGAENEGARALYGKLGFCVVAEADGVTMMSIELNRMV